MELSLFLGRVIGMYFVIVGIAYVSRRDFLVEVIREFVETPALIAYSALINLIIGLMLIFSHNIWEMNWKVIITLVGYISLTKGLMNLFFPEWGRFIASKFSDRRLAYNVTGAITMLIGLFLLYSTARFE